MQAKLKVVEEDEKEAVDRLKQRYKNEDASTVFLLIVFFLCYGHLIHHKKRVLNQNLLSGKQSRQTKLCAKAPPIKKSFWGNISV